MIKIVILFILFAVSPAAGFFAFADQPGSAPDDKSSAQIPPIPSASDTAAADTHSSYLYDLKKLIAKSRENIKEVNEKIKEQAVLKRNQKREERAREYYEKGVELTNEGKLDEAREYFEKAIRITEHPEMAGYIKESQYRLRKQEDALHTQERQRYNQIKQDASVRKEDVEDAYKQAVELYKEKKFHPAKDAFEHVDEIAPDYRATSSYLKIIDQDIITSDAVAAKQQGIEIQRQQNEAEIARAKEKEMWRQQIEEKEKERKEQIDRQAAEVYDDAVELYKNKKFAQAKKKFEEVSWVIPDYKATMRYLGRIDRDAQKEQERVAREQEKALQEQRWEDEVERKKHEVQQQHELEAKERQHLNDLQEQAQFLYTAAVHLFDQKDMEESLEKFQDIEKLLPDFKSTRTYIARIEQWQFDHHITPKIEPAVVVPSSAPALPAPVEVVPTPLPPVTSTPAPVAQDITTGPAPAVPDVQQSFGSNTVKTEVSLEAQQQHVQDITALADRSVKLYRQIADIADDRSSVQMKRMMGDVDGILNNLKDAQEHLLRQMREEQERQQQEETDARKEEFRGQAEKMYQDGLTFFHDHDYTRAKIKFLELENTIPDYKATRRYLSRIDAYQKNANVEAVSKYEQNEADHLKQLQDKENAAETLRAQLEQQKQHNLELQQQAALQDLVSKASGINEEILRLSHDHDYEGMKAKFVQLENVITSFMTLKLSMMNQKDIQEHEKLLARESMRQHKEMMRSEGIEDGHMQGYDQGGASDVDIYKRREIMQEQNVLYSEAVDRYEHKKYSQARLLFGELADQHDRRAETWLKKVDHAITQELLKSQVGEEKEQTAFLEDQLKAQHELIIIQERERQRQKRLTEEMERQKRLYEDDHLLQLRKEEILKFQERERQRQEAKRLQLEKQNERQAEMFRFHKIVVPPPPVAKPQTPPVAVSPAPPVAAAPSGMTAQQLQAQIDFSKERKAFLDNKYKKEQQEAAREARIKARAEEIEQRKEARQKEKERQQQLRAQRQEERQERIREEEQSKAQRAQAMAQQAAQEEKHREDVLHQQEVDREEKAKQDQIMREESQRREEFERQEHQRQAELEAQREAVRRQLEDGVEAMYDEAMSLYKQGEYTAAADKFKDVQDILPGYKHAGQFMEDARLKSLKPQSPPSPDDASQTDSTSPAPSPSSISHRDDVTKALDLFDPDAK